jgi:hypothetical protein
VVGCDAGGIGNQESGIGKRNVMEFEKVLYDKN